MWESPLSELERAEKNRNDTKFHFLKGRGDAVIFFESFFPFSSRPMSVSGFKRQWLHVKKTAQLIYVGFPLFDHLHFPLFALVLGRREEAIKKEERGGIISLGRHSAAVAVKKEEEGGDARTKFGSLHAEEQFFPYLFIAQKVFFFA